MACLKYLATCPCPRCLTLKSKVSRLGTNRDLCNRQKLMRIDNIHQQYDIEQIRTWLFKDGINISSVAIKRVLGPKLLTPTRVCHSFNFYLS
jgi:hypothetical protein